MNVKDFSHFLDENGEISFVERIRGTLKYGGSWYRDAQAQEMIISRLQSHLDDEYTILRNFTLPELDVTIPLILIGPTGLHVIYGSAQNGIYEAEGDQWKVMNPNLKRFRPARPNLITRTKLLNRAVTRHLKRLGSQEITPEPLLIFTDPEVHVDTKSPAVRIVMADALDHFAVSLTKVDPILGAGDIPKLVKLLQTPPPQTKGEGDEALAEDAQLKKAFHGAAQASGFGQATEIELPLVGKIRFSNRQWAILGALFFLNVIVLIIFIIVVFRNPLV